MPDVSGIAALDVLIGLFFLYFILSIACSALNELVATAFNFRARTLEDGIRSLLGSQGDVTEFFDHWRVRVLSKPKGKVLPRRKPSYIPSRTFALTVLDTLAPPTGGTESHDLVARARAALAADESGERPLNGRVRKLLRDGLEEARHAVGPAKADSTIESAGQVYQALKTAAQAVPPDVLENARRAAVAEADAIARRARVEIDQFRAVLERSFDEVMDRASGWYKRRVHWFLLAIAIVLVGSINADSFSVAQRLWKDKALRAAVVQQANKTVAAGSSSCVKTGQTAAEQAGDCVDQVEQLGIPLGWSKATNPDGWGWLGKLGGLLITALALSLGAPFWFDLLGKVARLRGAGPPSPPPEAAPLPEEPTQKTSAY